MYVALALPRSRRERMCPETEAQSVPWLLFNGAGEQQCTVSNASVTINNIVLNEARILLIFALKQSQLYKLARTEMNRSDFCSSTYYFNNLGKDIVT